MPPSWPPPIWDGGMIYELPHAPLRHRPPGWVVPGQPRPRCDGGEAKCVVRSDRSRPRRPRSGDALAAGKTVSDERPRTIRVGTELFDDVVDYLVMVRTKDNMIITKTS